MNLINYFIFIALWWAMCLLFFTVVQKPLFFIANRRSCPRRVTAHDVADVYRHGWETDAIMASYLTAVPLLLGLLATLLPQTGLERVMLPYLIIAALAMGLLTVADTALYGFWSSKIDASVFAYLRHPKDAFASVSYGYIAVGVLATLLVSAIFFAGGLTVTDIAARLWREGPQEWWIYTLAPVEFLLMTAICAVIIRGLRLRPNNPSIAYYSSVSFLNHWAINPGYNMIYSFGTQNEYGNRFRFFTPEECRGIVGPLCPTAGITEEKLLKTDRPNILTIVWESFGEEFCGAIGGRPEVTPCFNKLAEEGVLFTNCRASSFRTDRAQPAIFCGLPGQPTASIIRHTRKLPNLPAFPRRLKELGYRTTAVYGGEMAFMHLADFFLSSGHTRLIARDDLPQEADRCKWGVNDKPLFDYVLNDIKRQTREGGRWMTTVLTLSSHEPFVVPYKRLADPVDNSMAYTDAALGDFMERLKKTPAWNDLLVVIVADHGLNRAHFANDRDHYSHIPLLLTGGAVKGPAKIDKIVCQTDIAATLCGQLGLDHSMFPFSRDVLADSYLEESSLHTYGDGFLFTDRSGYTDYDNMAGRAAGDTDDAGRERRGKAVLQALYEYIDKL